MAKYLPAEHALTGCDTVSYLLGIGKATALKAVMGGNHLNVLSQLGADEDNLMSEATAFITACYDSNIKRTNSKITSAPKLKSLPPTHAFAQTLQTWSPSSMDGRKAKMVQCCIQSHFHLMCLLHLSPFCN